MNKDQLLGMLEQVKNGTLSTDVAADALQKFPSTDLGFAVIDDHRQLRVGYPEVIYGEGKTSSQIVDIVVHMNELKHNILVTRVDSEVFEAVQRKVAHAQHNKLGRTISVVNQDLAETKDYIAIVSAGTSDLPVVEEAYVTAKLLGNQTIKIVDVGVAGIHRLFKRLDDIRGAKVVIVIAGMEGALASVVAGLVDKPVIAIPTSVGYGANLGGITALLSMVNSCASGVTVVNIDNGFGAAYSASMINHL
ncbi:MULTISPECIES: nickel pincer cofactor biosynthesis protein LarB [unclassified Fusibacter]|uniref:nickel pincer cofactor biosynthesis protein LarB n=1 Tax=unclassified Fusibacter TaxID=2624464 RepID=UPI00101328D2|nr:MULTISPECIES: nickel pincer cofactor biosynthesis protein LarB [unclassified Fusibacter]MCK8060806.1 nickel pincer cofactor biosynthesis protein LarB [Fusibacter sp. A2]NPE23102.1 nickel pincer cofactor biosynthesis protein LarB [Fusibacter sp. A1]RXV59773.1 nickel pincer cofactor biosynthesis protein LarB [Fusibacter sp. A1]